MPPLVLRGTRQFVSGFAPLNASARGNSLLSDDVAMSDGDRDVLSSLPRTRPERRSAKREARSPVDAAAAAGPAAARPAAPKAKPKPTRAKARSAPKAAPQRDIPPAGYAVPKHSSPVGGGADLAATAVQALGELAQMGASLGGRVVRDALRRLPRP
jgi:hypothetical protein